MVPAIDIPFWAEARQGVWKIDTKPRPGAESSAFRRACHLLNAILTAVMIRAMRRGGDGTNR